jgi:predicted nucleic acid-binding protein
VIVYVESNFVLELAFMQEEHAECEGILRLAEAGVVQLAMPAFSVGEPYETLVRRHRERRALANKLTDELKQLRRSAPYQATVRKLDGLTELLVESGQQETRRLNDVFVRLLDTATVLPIDREFMNGALAAQKDLGLSPQDSIVYASVRRNVLLEKGQQCFVNKNAKDFLIPKIEDEFTTFNCKLIPRFSAGLAYLRAVLAKVASPNGAP